MSKAHEIVDTLLETNEKWDKAHASFRDLYRLKMKSMELMKEMGRSIEYYRALAAKGLRKEDVLRPLVGAQIGATHNYKQHLPAATCKNEWCALKGKHQPDTSENCSDCHQPLVPSMRPISASDLRGKMAKHIVGVETKDGRNVFFDEPLSNTPWNDWRDEPEETKSPETESEQKAQRRLGKWW